LAKTPTTAAEKPETDENLPAVQARGAAPAHLQDDLEEFSGAGMSDRQQDFLLPFLYVAQSNSPQLKRQQGDKFIPGLEAGDIFNTATGKFWRGSEGVLVLPAFFQTAEVEWITRKAGGGYVATHQSDDPIVRTARANPADPRERLLPVGPDGKLHQLVDTRYHFVILADELSPAVIGLTSTGLQVSRQWNTLMREFKLRNSHGQMVTAPSWSRAYRIKTVYRTNDQGDWFQIVVSDEGWSTPEQEDARVMARQFFREARERGVVLGRPPETDTVATPHNDDESGIDDSDIPI